MIEQILFRNVMKITEGSLEPFREAGVERNGPQLMVQTFIDEQEMRAVSFQLYRNCEDVLRHWEISDPHIRAVSKHCSVEKFEIYGNPSDEVAAGLSQFFGDGRGHIMKPLAGFTRFQSTSRKSV